MRGDLGAVGILIIKKSDFDEKGWTAPTRRFIGIRNAEGLKAAFVAKVVLTEALGTVTYSFMPAEHAVLHDFGATSRPRAAQQSLRLLLAAAFPVVPYFPELPELAKANSVAGADNLVTKQAFESGYSQLERTTDEAEKEGFARTIASRIAQVLDVILELLLIGSTEGLAYINGRIAEPKFFRQVGGFRFTQGLEDAERRFQQKMQGSAPPAGGEQAELPDSVDTVVDTPPDEAMDQASQQSEGDASMGNASQQAEGAGNSQPENQPMEGVEEGDAVQQEQPSKRGNDPKEPTSKSAPRVIGRASERNFGPGTTDDAAILHYFLVFYPGTGGKKGKNKTRRFAWKRLDQMMSNTDLRAAFGLLPPERQGDDPDDRGWVTKITAAEGPSFARIYYTSWFVWMTSGVPIAFRKEWRPRNNFVNQELPRAYDVSRRRVNGSVEDEDSDDEDNLAQLVPDSLQESAVGTQTEPDRTASEPSSLKWDAAYGRPRLSLRAAVRNHYGNSEYTYEALQEYTLTRQFVLISRVPPEDPSQRPSQDEITQMGDDLMYCFETTLRAQWKRARTLAKRRREKEAQRAEEEEYGEEDDEAEEGEEDGEDDGEEEGEEEYEEEEEGQDEDEEVEGEGEEDNGIETNDDDDDDDEAAETKWRKRTTLRLIYKTVARWKASQDVVKTEMKELIDQWTALSLMKSGDADRAAAVDAAILSKQSERVKQIMTDWRDQAETGEWTRHFARPRLKLPAIRDYLSANRSTPAERWLELQRKEHAESDQIDRETGIMGSILGSTWLFDGVPTATQAPGEHAVPVEWFSPQTQLLLETRDGTQNPTQIAIALKTENSKKGQRALGIFSPEDERTAKYVYTPEQLSDAKKAALAKAIAYSFVAYPALSNKSTTKGVASLKKGSGVAVYGRAWKDGDMKPYVDMKPTGWERRIQLLNLAMPEWQTCNPFVLYHGNSSVASPDMAMLIHRRFEGEDKLLQLCDEALGNSVVLPPS
jgi:hypothetical protein